jgi:hypothetical protein
MSGAARELLFILLLMGFLLVICAAAVYVFIRQWRRERRGYDRKNVRRH